MPIGKLLRTFGRNIGCRLRPLLFGTTGPAGSGAVFKTPPSKVEASFVCRARLVVEAHLSEPRFSVKALCQACHTTQPQLYRKLVALTGRSPVHFIHAIRLQKAQQLLRLTTLTIAEIAYETGFSSPAYFSRLFVKTFGLTPSDYRKNGGLLTLQLSHSSSP
ncbi:MAG: helix-turn-helix transcriptional regulator [Saprospirales bacterium]|nr:helix-turn-helix transcriptional regulator [Saprospirales bacterium]